jgi:hypothetical protein
MGAASLSRPPPSLRGAGEILVEFFFAVVAPLRGSSVARRPFERECCYSCYRGCYTSFFYSCCFCFCFCCCCRRKGARRPRRLARKSPSLTLSTVSTLPPLRPPPMSWTVAFVPSAFFSIYFVGGKTMQGRGMVQERVRTFSRRPKHGRPM